MMRLFGALHQETDYRRWSDSRNIDTSWESRTERAAALVPDNSRVVEFGAANKVLAKFLDPSCSYVPSDLVNRGPGTLVIDLNERPLPDLGADTYDVAVIMGVLEYVRDVPTFIDWLARHFSVCVLSYESAKSRGRPLLGKLEAVSRLNKGWMNSYRDAEIRDLFRARGFVSISEDRWKKQRLYRFSQHALPE